MSEGFREQPVRLVVNKPILLAPYLTLPTATYDGYKTQIGVYYKGELVWTAPEYTLALAADDIRSLGGDPGAALAISFNMTEHVGSGRVGVSDLTASQTTDTTFIE